MNALDLREWLEPDGLGGFTSGTVSGVRTRRYHALLLAATEPPVGRAVLVSGFEAWVESPEGRLPLTSQAYLPDVVQPDGWRRLAAFDPEPWPRWRFELGRLSIEQELVVPRGRACVALRFTPRGDAAFASLCLRPLLAGRDYHALLREGPATSPDVELLGGEVIWRPSAGLPAIRATSSGDYRHHPDWYRQFRYDVERERGLDFVEDLLAPGTFRWDLARGEATLLLEAGADGPSPEVGAIFAAERERRASLPGPFGRAADAYLVRRGEGATIVAGYPWFTDWGRDTFISLRGLCLATGRGEVAKRILLEWSGAVSEGMLPNRFPDRGEAPEYNSVDASLWFLVAVGELERAGVLLSEGERARLEAAADEILEGYATGTRHGIRAASDGLLSCGEPGSNLTWMDARYDGHAVTPRIGKPVEVEALWLNALAVAGRRDPRWKTLFERGRAAFEARFWNEARGCLFDVVDDGHVTGRTDDRLRPNQLFAAGGLPLTLLAPERARRVVDLVEARLWTPLGLRTLAPGEPGYRGRYRGGRVERDEAYHQGTAWPWLVGPFVEAWWRVRGETAEAAREADDRFLAPLRAALSIAGLGQLTEVADGDLPQAPGGCPFQAWSIAELLRATALLKRG